MEIMQTCISSKTLTMNRMNIIFSLLLCCSIGLIAVFNHLAEMPPLKTASATATPKNISYKTPEAINAIPLPEGYKRITVPESSFAQWLRNIQLRKKNTVYLYDGNPKANQNLHYAVLDLSTGNKDLQQCADAIMRLRAEYYFSRKEYAKIDFKSANSDYNFQKFLNNADVAENNLHAALLGFMEKVFINCGTYTVDAMTTQIAIKEIQPGDVFVKAGAPGHAMIIMDAAVHEISGKKIYLLAQGFMPAQDMHIVINPNDDKLSPWYEVNETGEIITPGYMFGVNNCKRFK